METFSLVTLAESFAAHRALSLSTVSTYARNDGKFFIRLKGGAGCTVRTAATVAQWFSDNWPDDLEWPRDIARPAKSRRVA